MKKKIFIKGGFALLLALGVFAFASCSNGGDDDDDDTEQTTQTVTDSATSGTVSSSAVTTDSGSRVATLTDSAGGVYTFTENATSSRATTTGGTWTYTLNGVVKYSGTYTGDISVIGTSATTLSLVVTKAANSSGVLESVKEQKTFDFTLTATTFTAEIPAVEIASDSSSSSSTSTDLSAFSTPTLSELAGKTYMVVSDQDYDENGEKVEWEEEYFIFSATGITFEKYEYEKKDGSVSCRKSSKEYVCTYENGVLTKNELDDGEVEDTETYLLRKYDSTLYLIYSDLTLARTSGSGLYATFGTTYKTNVGKLDEVHYTLSIALSSDKKISFNSNAASTGGHMTDTSTGTGTFTVKDNIIVTATVNMVSTFKHIHSNGEIETEEEQYDTTMTMIYDGSNLLSAEVLTATTTLPTVTE